MMIRGSLCCLFFNENPMKLTHFFVMTLLLTGTSMVNASQNPFFVNSYQTPHETLPFDKVKMEHFLPAFEKGFAQQDKQIKSITSNQEAPTFKNTLETLEYSGSLLHDVSAVFYTLTGSENKDELMALSTKVAAMFNGANMPLLSVPLCTSSTVRIRITKGSISV